MTMLQIKEDVISYLWLCFRYEKMISGMYMGEIVRLVLEKLRKAGLIFHGKGSEELSSRGRFYTKYVSEIERLDDIKEMLYIV